MPGKTQADRLLDLENVVPRIDMKLQTSEKAADALSCAHQETVGKVGDLRLAFETTIVLLKKEIEDLKKWKEEQKKETEERTKRIWAFGPNALAALIGGLFALLVSYVAKQK